jgi:signal transduction histidine kinase
VYHELKQAAIMVSSNSTLRRTLEFAEKEPFFMTKTRLDFPFGVDLEEKISLWAHDLRSPFNQLIGFTKVVLNGQSGPLTELQKEDLSTVYRNGLRAMSLVNNLIEIARLQRGEKGVNRGMVELQPFLDQSIAQWRKNNPERDIPIATILSVPSASVELDKAHAQSILNGFLSYLAAYGEGSGQLAIEVTLENDSLVLTLRQTGITKAGHDDVTMEMSAIICRAYLELQGGTIRQSEAGDGEIVIQFAIPASARA